MAFLSPTKGQVSDSELIIQIAEFMNEMPEHLYQIVIGTDSQIKHTNGVSETDFVTAIIVHRKGFGARYFVQKQKMKRAMVLRDKIYTETTMSLETAQSLVPKLREVLSTALYDFEIHIDVGPQGPTREMIKEVVGMVHGNGFVARTKPNSWGASSVADKHT